MTDFNRSDLTRQLDELDAQRLADLQAIFAREEVQQALADLNALLDPSDAITMLATPWPAGQSVTTLANSAITVLTNVPQQAAAMAEAVAQRLAANPAPSAP